MTTEKKKTILITGGNRGIGYETARQLLAAGQEVVFTARRPEAGQAALQGLRAEYPAAVVDYILLDLADFDSIRQAAGVFHQRGQPLDVLINNAGLLGVDDQVRYNQAGFELVFTTNYLGHFLLTYLLLPDMLAAPAPRLVAVSSQTHIPGYGAGPAPDFDFENLKAEKYYQPQVFYKNSKLAIVWFVYELDRRLAGHNLAVNAVCPGWVPETIGDNQDGFLKKFLFKQVLARLRVARTPEQGASRLVHAALSPELAAVSGKFIADNQPIPSSAESYDLDKAARLWALSCQWLDLPLDWVQPAVPQPAGGASSQTPGPG
jgi:NAD(P)-dependent dehydrogenase (short-subunit alcohol dehydrogenase family)